MLQLVTYLELLRNLQLVLFLDLACELGLVTHFKLTVAVIITVAFLDIVSIDKTMIKATLSKEVHNGTALLRLVNIIHLVLVDISDVCLVGGLVKIIQAVLVNRALVEVFLARLFFGNILCFIIVEHKIVVDFSDCVAIRVALASDSTLVLVLLTVVGLVASVRYATMNLLKTAIRLLKSSMRLLESSMRLLKTTVRLVQATMGKLSGADRATVAGVSAIRRT